MIYFYVKCCCLSNLLCCVLWFNRLHDLCFPVCSNVKGNISWLDRMFLSNLTNVNCLFCVKLNGLLGAVPWVICCEVVPGLLR